MRSFKLCQFLILVVLFGFGGCGSNRDAEFIKASNDSNMKKMGSAYQLFASRNGYNGPTSKDELVAFLKSNEKIKNNLRLMECNIDQLEEYFVSENDGQEFQFRWGVFVNPDVDRAKEPIIFERRGKEGIRLVMLTNRKILQIENDKKYNQLLSGNVGSEDAKTELEQEE